MTTTIKSARRIIVLVIGGSLLVLGIALLVLPGPGLLLSAAGLGVLSLEFVWARGWLARIRRGISDVSRERRIKNRT